MRRFSAWLQTGLVGLAILLIGAVGVAAINGQLRPGNSQSPWELTVLHTNDVRGSVEPCA